MRNISKATLLPAMLISVLCILCGCSWGKQSFTEISGPGIIGHSSYAEYRAYGRQTNADSTGGRSTRPRPVHSSTLQQAQLYSKPHQHKPEFQPQSRSRSWLMSSWNMCRQRISGYTITTDGRVPGVKRLIPGNEDRPMRSYRF